MAIMALVFAVIYPMTISNVGYRYKDAILIPTEENGKTVYSGKIEGEQAEFIVSNNDTVVLHYGDKTYGPYIVKEDATAIPKNDELSGSMTGIEMREGNDILFRGGVIDMGDYCYFYNEDGSLNAMLDISYETSDGSVWDGNGNPIDKMKPSVSTIYELVNDPELTHKGMEFMWFVAVFICILNVISIIFADELFQFSMSLHVRYPDRVEPSDWEIGGRYIGWAGMVIIALIIFVQGLQ